MNTPSTPIKRKAPDPDQPFGTYRVEDLRSIFNDCFRNDTPGTLVDLYMEGVDIHLPFIEGVDGENVSSLFGAVQAGAVRCVDKLISLGADIAFRDSARYTPLIEAATKGNVAILESLLNAGADIRDQSVSGSTALHVSCIHGYTDCARLLLDRGSSMNCMTELGYRPLHQAARGQYRHTLELLLMRGANPNAQAVVSPDMNGGQGQDGQTPLFIACEAGRMDMVHMLLKFGAKNDIRDDQNRTPFDYAALCGQLKVLPTLLDLGFAHGDLQELAKRIQVAVSEGNKASGLNACIDFLHARHAADVARSALAELGVMAEVEGEVHRAATACGARKNHP